MGLLARAQSQAVFILFMTEDAQSRLENIARLTACVNANVALVTLSAEASVTTQTGQRPVIGFVLTNGGLMESQSLSGNRITRMNLG